MAHKLTSRTMSGGYRAELGGRIGEHIASPQLGTGSEHWRRRVRVTSSRPIGGTFEITPVIRGGPGDPLEAHRHEKVVWKITAILRGGPRRPLAALIIAAVAGWSWALLIITVLLRRPGDSGMRGGKQLIVPVTWGLLAKSSHCCVSFQAIPRPEFIICATTLAEMDRCWKAIIIDDFYCNQQSYN